METLNVIDHDIVIIRGRALTTGQRVYRADCSCGWASDWTDDQADADDARYDHEQVVL